MKQKSAEAGLEGCESNKTDSREFRNHNILGSSLAGTSSGRFLMLPRRHGTGPTYHTMVALLWLVNCGHED